MPFPPQSDTWVARRYDIGRALGALACATTVAVLTIGYARVAGQRPEYVQIAAYEDDDIVLSSGNAQALVISPAAPVPRSNVLTPSPVEAKIKPRGSAGPTTATTSAPAATYPPTDLLVARASQRPAVATTPKVSMHPASDMPSAPAATEKSSVATTGKAPISSSPTAAVAGAAEPETKLPTARTAEKKPTDIASGAALGIREVLADGIVMTNGRKIKNGAALPNGELLITTDPAKGLAETDRRVMIVTP